jgi:calcineurin-like phosphoesterase family protein
MTKWIASDLHINHRQIPKYCPKRATGIVYDALSEDELTEVVDDMNERIINNWNELIAPGDDVYILGDVAMGQIKFAPPLIRRLNGKKFLIAGNHDEKLIQNIGKDSSLNDLFVNIKDYHEMGHSVDGEKVKLCMSHFPFRHWNGQNRGAIMAHGHLHDSPCDVPGRIFNVGIDNNDLKPFKLDDVVRKMLLITEFGNHH